MMKPFEPQLTCPECGSSKLRLVRTTTLLWDGRMDSPPLPGYGEEPDDIDISGTSLVRCNGDGTPLCSWKGKVSDLVEVVDYKLLYADLTDNIVRLFTHQQKKCRCTSAPTCMDHEAAVLEQVKKHTEWVLKRGAS